MKVRANWYLCLAILAFALLGLSGPAAANDAPAALQDVTVIDTADSVIPDANHYKCYPILSHTEFHPRHVFLKDQFWSTWVWVLRPHYLCNPVWKTTEDGSTYAPPQPEAHLVCYDIQEEIPTPDWKVKTYDQFGWLELKGNRAELLCLPAAKYLISGPGH